MKQKILKIKTGEVFVGGKSVPVFQTAYERKSKKGTNYYEIRNPVFVQVIDVAEKQQEITPEKVEA